MERAQKTQMVADLKESFAAAQSVVLTDFRGMTVAEMMEMRRVFSQNGVEFRVIKNTLAKLAAEGTPAEVLLEDFVGTTAVALSREDPTAPAREVCKFAKGQKKLVVKCGHAGEGRMDPDAVLAFSKLPTLPELRATLLGTLTAPAGNLARLLAAVPQKMVLALQARRDQMEQAS